MSAPHDPWVNVRTFDVSTYGDCRMERDYYGDITSEQTHQRGECAWVDEVDAARAADAAEIATLRATVDQQQARITALEAALKFYANPFGRIDADGEPQRVPDFYSEMEFGEVARQALETP